MPEELINETLILIHKCARCFKDMETSAIFCSKECADKGYLYPRAWGNNFSEIQDKKERRRLQVLAAYHRNKKLKVIGRGAPRKDGSNLINPVLYPAGQ